MCPPDSANATPPMEPCDGSSGPGETGGPGGPGEVSSSGTRVYCHDCSATLPMARAAAGPLLCPSCHGEFVEIVGEPSLAPPQPPSFAAASPVFQLISSSFALPSALARASLMAVPVAVSTPSAPSSAAADAPIPMATFIFGGSGGGTGGAQGAADGGSNDGPEQPPWLASLLAQIMPTVDSILQSLGPSAQGTPEQPSPPIASASRRRPRPDQEGPGGGPSRPRPAPRPFVAAFVQQIADGGGENMPVDDLRSLLFSSFSELLDQQQTPPAGPSRVSDVLRSLLQQGLQGVQISIPAALGDYVFGDRAFDELLSQLMEQGARERAPPPAPPEAISRLPRAPLEPLPESSSECIVCKEPLHPAADMPVPVGLTLPCRHVFHEDCIVPWLQINGTCPICRSALLAGDGGDSSPLAGAAGPAAQQPPGPAGSQ